MSSHDHCAAGRGRSTVSVRRTGRATNAARALLLLPGAVAPSSFAGAAGARSLGAL